MKGEEDLSEKRKFRREIEVEKKTVTNQLFSLKISLRVWSEFLVNSVKIDGDGEATDFENYIEVENVFILSKR